MLLAYTNRFIVLANLIRSLHEKNKTDPNSILTGQIKNLRHRINLIKYMQTTGVSSIFFCVLCMFTLYAGLPMAAKAVFAICLILMLVSLALSLMEIWISVNALNIHLSDMEEPKAKSAVAKKTPAL